MSSGGWGKATQVSATQRAGSESQEKINTSPYLASFSLQCRAAQGGTEVPEKISRTSRGLVAVKICWEGHFDNAVKIDVSNIAKAKRTVKRQVEPRDISKPTTGLCTALERDKIQLHQPEQRHKLPQPGKYHRTLIQPHPQGQTPQPKECQALPNSFYKVTVTQISKPGKENTCKK